MAGGTPWARGPGLGRSNVSTMKAEAEAAFPAEEAGAEAWGEGRGAHLRGA